MLIIIKPLINFSELAAGQMSTLLLLHLVSFWASDSTSLKVFSFEKTLEASGSLSVATLDSKTSEALPPRFKDVKEEIRIQLLFPQICVVLVSQAGCLGPTGSVPHVWSRRPALAHNQVLSKLSLMYGIDNQPWLTIRLSQLIGFDW